MTSSDSLARPAVMLEQKVADIYRAMLGAFMPVKACLFAVAGSQAYSAVFGGHDYFGLGVHAAVMAGSACLSWMVVIAIWPSSQALRQLLSVGRNRLGPDLRIDVVAVAAIGILVGLFAPLAIALPLWIVLLCIHLYHVATCSMVGGRVEKVLGTALQLAGMILVALACVAIGEHWASSEREVARRLGGVVVPLLVLLVLAARVGVPLRRVIWRATRLAKESMVTSGRGDAIGSASSFWRYLDASTYLFAVGPWLANGFWADESSSYSLVLLLVSLGYWPVVLLQVYLTRRSIDQLHRRHDFREIIGRRPSDGGLIGANEDEVRENDGYYRVSFPEYRHWSSDLAGEAGYLSWIGGAANAVLPPQGRCAVFRTTSLRRNHLCEVDDVVGRALGRVFLDFFPDRCLSGAGDLVRCFRQSWSVASTTGNDSTMLPKMPWDHPFVMAVPYEWTGTLVFPAGSGIHDHEGYPCQVRGLKVALSLRPPVRAAVEDISEVKGQSVVPAVESVRLCRELVWNATRILPAVYETTLTSLVHGFRKISIEAFLDNSEQREAPGGAKTSAKDFLVELQHSVAGSLPAPIGELVDVAFEDLAVDTYFMQNPREQLFALMGEEQNVRLSRLRGLNGIMADVGKIFDKDAPMSLERLDQVRQKILRAASTAESGLVNAFQELDQTMPVGGVREARSAVHDQKAAFVDRTSKGFDQIREAMIGLRRRFGSFGR